MSSVRVDRSNNNKKVLAQDKKPYIFNFDPQSQSTGELPIKTQGLISHDTKSRISREQTLHTRQVTEAQDLMTSVEWIPEEKLGVQHSCAPSKKFTQ